MSMMRDRILYRAWYIADSVDWGFSWYPPRGDLGSLSRLYWARCIFLCHRIRARYPEYPWPPHDSLMDYVGFATAAGAKPVEF